MPVVMRASPPIGDTRRDAWIVGDGDVEALKAAAEACALRVTRCLPITEAREPLASRGDVLVLVQIGEVLSDRAATILDLIDMQARDSRTAAIVSCLPPALDQVAARLAAPFAAILCDASAIDLVIALHCAGLDVSGVAENDRKQDIERLMAAIEESARLARIIAGLPNDGYGAGVVSDKLVGYRGPPGANALSPVTAKDIRAVIRWRRRRDGLFPGEMFADPAWDMILDLAAARLESAEVAVSSLCIAAAVPPTTALRWIKTLTDARIFERVADPFDRRRVYIRLSDKTADATLRFLGEAKDAGALLI